MTLDELDRQAERIKELERQVEGYQKECAEVDQELGKALGYPWYKDDQKNFPGATDKDGVCTGENTPGSLALGAAQRIRALETAEKEMRERAAQAAQYCHANERRSIAAAIRALPLKGEG